MLMRATAAMLLSTVVAHNVQADESVAICAKYRVDFGWSKNYKVSATLMTGQELNRETRTFDFDGFAKYVVIFWDKGEASIIKLESSILGVFGVQGEDRRGVIWEVSKSTICF
jgi:hypothetical protein